nr:type II toxin-antitoxin system Phd/YefM family antitoxin [Butyricicoccus sp. TM115-253]
MNMIRPVSDLRNNFADISKTVHETAQPVFLTKNGYGDMVVLSMEAFENLQFESVIESDESRYWRGAGCINWSTYLLLSEIWLKSRAISVESCKTPLRQSVWQWSL